MHQFIVFSFLCKSLDIVSISRLKIDINNTGKVVTQRQVSRLLKAAYVHNGNI